MARQILVEILGDASKFDKATQQAASSGTRLGNVLQGIGQGLGQQAFGLIEKGANMAVEAIGGLIEAGMEGEAADARLNQAIKDNTDSTKDFTAAIARAADAGVQLGFADDKVKDSLATLVRHTHDTGAAISALSVAEDLARTKKIDLTEAADALGKGLEGNKKVLKDLGVNVADVAGKEETLAAVHQATAGQAEAFGNTSAGAFAKFDAEVDRLKENLGQSLLPVLTSTVSQASNLMEALSGSTKDVVQADEQLVGSWVRDGHIVDTSLLPSYSDLTDEETHLLAVKDRLANDLFSTASEREANANQLNWVQILKSNSAYAEERAALAKSADARYMAARASADQATATEAVSRSTWRAGEAITKATEPTKSYAAALQSVTSNVETLIPHLDELFGIIYGPAEAKGKFAEATQSVKDLKSQIEALDKKMKSDKGKDLIADRLELDALNGKLADARGNLLEAAVDLYKVGDASQKAAAKKQIHTWLDSTHDKAKAAGGEIWDAWQKLDKLINTPGKDFTLTVTGQVHKAFMAGGILGSGETGLVGEAGPELVTNAGGPVRIWPTGTGPGGVTQIFNIHIGHGAFIDGPSVDRLANELARRVRYAGGI